MTTTDYTTFLESKIKLAEQAGMDVTGATFHPSTFPHQRDAALWALKTGRALMALSYGLGKTHIQLEMARIIQEHEGGLALIVCPLGVKYQFVEEDGPRLGIVPQYVRTDEEIRLASTPYLITNYERIRDGDIDPRNHNITYLSLDEGSVLRSLGSKTFDVFFQVCGHIPYRYAFSATPSPNNYLELINYAHFLGVMDRGQALTRWFKRDSTKAGNLTLYESQAEDFWLWVSSWAFFLYRPSDLGYDDTGYDLPELRVHWHRLPIEDYGRIFDQTDNRGQHRMLPDASGNIQDAAREKRATLPARLVKMQEILAQHPDRHWLIWHHLEAERKAIEQAVPGAVSVYGSQDLEKREQAVMDFSRGKIQILATKPELSGSGCNFQHYCHSNIFLGVRYQFEEFIQSLHRTRRYLQTKTVDVHIIYSEGEDKVVDTLKRKWTEHDELTERMRQIVKTYGLSHAGLKAAITRRMGVTRHEHRGERFTAIRNDCVAELEQMADDSVGAVITSTPFGTLYEYTEQYEDFGHNLSSDEFFRQMDFLIPHLYRVLKPGRVAVMHVKDRILYSHNSPSGIMEQYPFSDEMVAAMRRHGFTFQGRCTIVTDVVRENNQTYRLGYSEMCNDGTKMGFGLPEYLLLFRKPPTNRDNARADEPVRKSKADYSIARWQVDAHGYWRSDSNRMVARIPRYDYEAHVERLDALEEKGNLPKTYLCEAPASFHPDVWTDVVAMHGLNMIQARRGEENHVCPLPFDIVRRAIARWTNPDDLILDPFGGIGTVPYCAIEAGRRAIATELNEEYWRQMVKYCVDIERKVTAPTLFDWLAEQEHEAVAV